MSSLGVRGRGYIFMLKQPCYAICGQPTVFSTSFRKSFLLGVL